MSNLTTLAAAALAAGILIIVMDTESTYGRGDYEVIRPERYEREYPDERYFIACPIREDVEYFAVPGFEGGTLARPPGNGPHRPMCYDPLRRRIRKMTWRQTGLACRPA